MVAALRQPVDDHDAEEVAGALAAGFLLKSVRSVFLVGDQRVQPLGASDADHRAPLLTFRTGLMVTPLAESSNAWLICSNV